MGRSGVSLVSAVVVECEGAEGTTPLLPEGLQSTAGGGGDGGGSVASSAAAACYGCAASPQAYGRAQHARTATTTASLRGGWRRKDAEDTAVEKRAGGER